MKYLLNFKLHETRFAFIMRMWLGVALLILSLLLFHCQKATKNTGVIAKDGMVVTEHYLATEVGASILKKGGNAYDAAIAIHYALTVVLPRAGNLTGGGFFVYRDPSGGTGFLDFREKAPLAAHRDMYLDKEGNFIKGASTKGALAIGVPGSAAGMTEVYSKFASLPFDVLIQPAIDLATNGYAITEGLADRLNRYKDDFVEVNSISDENINDYPFVKKDRWLAGDTLRLLKLATTMERMKADAGKNFYKGDLARDIVGRLQERGSIFTLEDMEKYSGAWRTPTISKYKDYKIITSSPPSSGVIMCQILGMMNLFDLSKMKHNSVEYVHLFSEVANRAYADRSEFLGDPDFTKVPEATLLASNYLRMRSKDISLDKRTPSSEISSGDFSLLENMETTHYSIVDKEGNAVSVTTTLNGNFGSKVYLPELGLFMNNEMDDFSSKPGHPNMFGLLGGEANAIVPEKRMLSSMTPTIVEHNGKLKMVLGTPGGSTIITAVAQSIINVVSFGMTMQEAVDAKRIHAQWYPEQIKVERGALSPTVKDGLEAMGHKIKEIGNIALVEAILVREDGTLEGAADRNRCDAKAIGIP